METEGLSADGSQITPDAPSGDTLTDEQVQHAETAIHGVEGAVQHTTVGTVVTAATDVAALAGDAPAIVEETRRGYLTTEFWAVVFTVAADAGLDLSDKTKALITGVVSIYALARGIAKKGIPNIKPILG